jgi:TetR/AcrR family acrAB operon transcriptional repressor
MDTLNRKKEQGAKTREELLAAAIRVFGRRGYQRATMEDIVEEVGTTRGALYWHFANKEAFLVALLERAAKARTIKWADSLELQGPADRLLAEVLHADVDQNAQLPWLNRMVITVGLDADNISPEVGRILRGQMAVNRHLLSRLVKYGQQQGVFRRDLDANETGAALYAARLGVLTTFYLDSDSFEIRSIMRSLIRTLMPGLLAPGRRFLPRSTRNHKPNSADAVLTNVLSALGLPSEPHPTHETQTSRGEAYANSRAIKRQARKAHA